MNLSVSVSKACSRSRRLRDFVLARRPVFPAGGLGSGGGTFVVAAGQDISIAVAKTIGGCWLEASPAALVASLISSKSACIAFAQR